MSALSMPCFLAADPLAAAQPNQTVGNGALDVPANTAFHSGLGRVVYQVNTTQTGPRINVPVTSEFVVGYRALEGAFGTHTRVLIYMAGHATAVITTSRQSGNLRVTVAGVNYDTATAWGGAIYVEIYVKVHATDGHIIVRVDGVEVINEDEINTQGSATGGVNSVQWQRTLSGVSETGNFTDVYLREAPIGNPFYGPIQTRWLKPADDDQAEWVRDSGSTNAARVADSSGHDGSSSYVESDTLDDTDIYELDNLPGGVNSVIAVVPFAVAVAPDGGAPQVEMGVETSGGVVQTGPRTVGVTLYQMQLGVAQVEQPGGGGWSIAAVDELKLHVRAA